MSQEFSDIRQFERFYHENFIPVMRYSFTLVKSQSEAGDIVQQAFLVLWEKRQELPIHTSAKAYLYKMVYNHSLRHLEQNERRRNREKASAGSATPNADPAGHRELQDRISKAVDSLPEQCRRIFKMSREEDLKYREIATRLRLSEKTVENQMGKALKLLRQSLKDYLPLLLLIIFYHHDR